MKEDYSKLFRVILVKYALDDRSVIKKDGAGILSGRKDAMRAARTLAKDAGGLTVVASEAESAELIHWEIDHVLVAPLKN